MKPAATKAAILLRLKLQALAKRGHEGEADSAKKKLARLEARYDFTASAQPGEQAKGDIFAGIAFNIRSHTARELASFPVADSELASFVQWAVSSAAGVNGSLRQTADWRLIVMVEAEAHAIPKLAAIAETIRKSFRELWASYGATPGVQPAARKVFWLGLYDGLMNDDRKPGQMLPAMILPKTKPTRGKRRLAIAPGVAIHPYSLALDLGRQIRFSVPIGAIVESLAATMSGARLPERTEPIAA